MRWHREAAAVHKCWTSELLILSLQLTVMPYLMMSFIRSSSMVVRKFSLGWSIKGTTSSKILATLQITIKSLWVCRDTISTFTLWPLDGNTTPLIAINPEFLCNTLTLHFVVRYGCIVMACFTISWGRILLNRYSVVIQDTTQLDIDPLSSLSAKQEKQLTKSSTKVKLLLHHSIPVLPPSDSSYFTIWSTRLSTSWTQAFLAGLYEASSSDFSNCEDIDYNKG